MSLTELPEWMDVIRGDSPLILSFPHTGTDLPADLVSQFQTPWLARKDADWWVYELYAFGRTMGATMVRSRISRSVIDLNRDPSGRSLYPGQTTTGLCPLESFDGTPLYKPGRDPGNAEIQRRLDRYFTPYHETLATEIQRVKARHGRVFLYDCHSIRSVIPRLFDGLLPVFNVGTNSGTSCAPTMQAAARSVVAGSGQPYVVNGRFRGGYITRFHGRPDQDIHAIQMELACRSYMDEPLESEVGQDIWPRPLDLPRATRTRATLRKILGSCLAALPRR